MEGPRLSLREHAVAVGVRVGMPFQDFSEVLFHPLRPERLELFLRQGAVVVGVGIGMMFGGLGTLLLGHLYIRIRPHHAMVRAALHAMVHATFHTVVRAAHLARMRVASAVAVGVRVGMPLQHFSEMLRHPLRPEGVKLGIR